LSAAKLRTCPPDRESRRRRGREGRRHALGIVHHLQEDEVAAFFCEQRGEFAESLRHCRFARQSRQVYVGGAAGHRHHVGQRAGNGDLGLSARRPSPERRAHGRTVDVLEAVGVTGRAEHQPRRGIGVGGDDVGARRDVVAVDRLQRVQVRQVRRPAPGLRVHGDAAPLQLRAGAAVEDDDPAVAEPALQAFIAHRLACLPSAVSRA
jgi:hypothetical protein